MNIFRKYVDDIQVSLKSNKNNSTLDEKLYNFLIIYSQILLRVKNVLDKCRENKNTYFMYNNVCFPKIVTFIRKCGKI